MVTDRGMCSDCGAVEVDVIEWGSMFIGLCDKCRAASESKRVADLAATSRLADVEMRRKKSGIPQGLWASVQRRIDSDGDPWTGSVLIVGKSGAGKSIEAAVIANRHMLAGRSAMWMSCDALMRMDWNDTTATIAKAAGVDALVVDALMGMRAETNATQRAIEAMICERDDAGLATIVTTSAALSTLRESMVDRACRRLLAWKRISL